MKRIGGVLLVLLGVSFLLVALLFLIAAARQPHRLLVAIALGGAGAVAVGVGIRSFRLGEALQPHRLRAEILELARREDGEVSETEVRAALGDRFEHARPVLERLLTEGLCRQRRHEESTFYVFPDLQARLTVRQCEFCDAELPVGKELASCPSCGGTFRTKVVRVALSDDSYGLDEG